MTDCVVSTDRFKLKSLSVATNLNDLGQTGEGAITMC